MVSHILVSFLGNRIWLKVLLMIICISMAFLLGHSYLSTTSRSVFPSRVRANGATLVDHLLLASNGQMNSTSFSSPNQDSLSMHMLSHVARSTPDCNSSSTAHTLGPVPTHRYIIEWFHWEQLTMATTSMITLSWFVSPWNANVIEPFTLNSRYFGIPHPYRKNTPLFSFLDYEKFNRLLCKHDIPPVLRFSEFLRYANRRVVVVHLLYNGFDMRRFGNRGASRTEILSLLYSKGGHYADCSDTLYMQRIGRVLLKWINLMSPSHPFIISHYCCINGSHPTYREEMAQNCRVPSDGDVTVVFTDWRGLSPLKNFRVFVPEAKNINLPRPSIDVYPYSSSVLRNASAFLNAMTSGSEFVGVHWRTEKLGQKGNKYFLQCLSSAQQIILKIFDRLEGKINLLHFSDTGPFGSKSCLHNCLSNEFVTSSFSTNGITLTHYSPSVFDGIGDSGFVASVEQEALSRARALVLVGGGSFQSQLYTRYRHYQKSSHIIYKVCHGE
uniref:Uncharacterized protein n=1 Tax=Amphimedon queenslandica TaxID=400682 RepID=A0A1X7UT75_AMPQE